MKEIKQRFNDLRKQWYEWLETEININLGTHMLITNNNTILVIVNSLIFVYCIAKLIINLS